MSEEQNITPVQTQQDISEQSRIRREKLANLQAEGKDPFQIMKYDVTHHSMDVKNEDAYAEMEGTTVSVAGRLMSKRPC